MDNRTILPVKSDIIFRLFYADERNKEILVSLLKSMLRLPEDDYHEIEIADPHLLREFEEDKLAIIDVKLYTQTRKPYFSRPEVSSLFYFVRPRGRG